MKKILAFALVCAIIFALCACEKQNDPGDTQSTGSSASASSSASTNNTESTSVPGQPGEFTEATFPRIDGSTATIPLSEGLFTELLGMDEETARGSVVHNRTHWAYENLINGDCDVIFVTPPSEEEMQMLLDADKEYEIVRVVKDALVFLVNSQNDIQSISSQDIFGIYTGAITNWKQVGGHDALILPYQRQANSGSQTMMYNLAVPQDKIMTPLSDQVVNDMEGLIASVAQYDAAASAIGYSVYYYASEMYVNAGSKLIAINGVEPSDETIADGSYPYIDGYYAIFSKDTKSDSPTRRLVDWILSAEGQRLMHKQGYVPLSPIK